ncbi:hypothetical protein BGZ65_002844 [Modicella reniformis]|uniref:Uncharacterized protein n=1 Tax=Modicella reniformis TaxID=1440133 RepID=A0A9P6LZT0_9FUNG|nr:hypothetical protein BGZ65_002844 [Modicella reniformis]
MSSDSLPPLIWTHNHLIPHPHLNAFSAVESNNDDPIKLWIAYLMEYGGFFTLMGVPALIAIPLFFRRMHWLKHHCKPHNYGRTNLIYWPSQIFIAVACLILVSFAVSLVSDGITDGFLPGVLLTLSAWATAIPLNRLEHRYQTRSSNHLFLYYGVTLWECLLALYILSEDNSDNDEFSPFSRFWYMAYFTIAITIAFSFEAYPRSNTRVQRLAREKENLSKYQQANLFSRQVYLFFQDIVSLGASRPLTAEDLVNTTPSRLFSRVNYNRVAARWEENKAHNSAKGKQPSFLFSVLGAYKVDIAVMLAIRMAGYTAVYFPPVLFSELLKFIENYSKAVKTGEEPPALKIGFVISGAMLFFNLASVILLCHSFQIMLDLGTQARAATVALIYRKSLRLSPQARQSSTVGEITNHMAVDAEKWIDAGIYYPMLFSVPELPFRKKIDEIRAKEIKALRGLATIRSLLTIVFSSVTLLMALCTFSVYAYFGGPNMTPGKVSSEVIFVSITLFGILNRPLGLVAHLISRSIGINVAMRRIQKFLLMEEIDSTVVYRYSRQPSGGDQDSNKKEALAVNIENGTFSWEKEVEPVVSNVDDATTPDDERRPLLASAAHVAQPKSSRPTLSNITLRIPDGSLTAIVGRIGQGKSSLLSAIMGELYKRKGIVTVHGDIAYVPQQAWIINATVRENILFGTPFNQEKYDRIIYASGLKPDLEMLTAGDQTEIGERGINLSGGQKQRVSLARAAYQDADIYLLDDPLSAVDAHVDQHLWENLIGPEGMLKDKTRVLVTHGIHHLEHVDQIVLLKDGTISEVGEYRQLMDTREAFYQLINDFSIGKKKKGKKHLIKQHVRDLLHGRKEGKMIGSGEISSATSTYSDSEGEASERNTIVGQEAPGDKEESGELIAEETMQAGRVGWTVLLSYAKAASYRNAIFCIFMFVASQACHLSTNFWLRLWVSESEARESEGLEKFPASYYLNRYGMLVLLYIFLDIIVNYTTEVVCGIRASKILHDRLLTRILRLPMSFFDVTPMGRIANRFSSDMNALDIQLPEEWNDLFAFISIIGGTLIVIAYSTPLFLIAIPPLITLYFWIQNYFIKSSSSLKRLYSVSKSPLYQHFSESLTGVSTIRVMKGLEQQFIKENEHRSDAIINRFNAYNYDNRWLQVRLESLGGLTVFIASTLAVWNAAELDPSLVGLALSYALNMIGFVNYLVRTVSEVQNLLVSVERVDEYSNKPTEAPIETGVHLPPNWPAEGRIVFKGYSARYREGLDLVVKDVSFTVEPTQSVGIVGRTGAGKSSLTLALFRIIEAADSYWARASDPSNTGENLFEDQVEFNGGSIEIDGIDISTLGLKDLRQHLSIIPQDPTLFAGTVRDNLDPFGEHSDKDLWEALERSHLKDHVLSLATGLSFEVAQNGDNFSVGQRSLICLARALLRKTKVLVLDEATAAVDVETDDLIQKTIRKEFKDRTVLTIAHRIKTVMDSDKILVLEKGCVQEYEAPSDLLKRKDSLFYKLAEQAGEL